VRAAAFRNRITDLIQYVVTDFTTFDGQNRNVEQARIQGVEVAYRWRGEAWSAHLEGTRSSPRDVSNNTWLLRRARTSATAGIERHFGDNGRHSVGLNVLRSGARTDFGDVRLAPYTVATLSANLELLPRWTAQLRLENLTDERYELAQGYNTPRRALFAGTHYSFR
jgi:vitamin B12 transporter